MLNHHRARRMTAAMLKEPRGITDFKQRIVCMLPVGFYFNDERREKIWRRFDEQGDTLSMADLKALFPDETTVQSPAEDSGETFDHRPGK